MRRLRMKILKPTRSILPLLVVAASLVWTSGALAAPAKLLAVVKGNAYGCGIGPITGALAKTGCKTFFVSNIPEAKLVRAAAPDSTIYVLNGLY